MLRYVSTRLVSIVLSLVVASAMIFLIMNVIPGDVAQMILACARDGRREREFPVGGGKLATLGYLVPGLRRTLKPLLERKGAARKQRLRRERSG